MRRSGVWVATDTKSWPADGEYYCPNGAHANIGATPSPLVASGNLACVATIRTCAPTFGGPTYGSDAEGPFGRVSSTERTISATGCDSGTAQFFKTHTYFVYDTSSECHTEPSCSELDLSCEQDSECCSTICNDFTYLCATGESPILIDVAGNGIALTNAPEGVLFDLRPDGHPELLSWTKGDGDDAWLVLDRNENGQIDDGTELFGNFTPQPPSPVPNGFLALRPFDSNQDGWIDAADGIYPKLQLWTDSNHDGVSQPQELRSLDQAGLLRISLDYRQSARRDRSGNTWRYRSKIVTANPSDGGPFAYDVFLVVDSASANKSTIRSPIKK